jgi:hypothetical protein
MALLRLSELRKILKKATPLTTSNFSRKFVCTLLCSYKFFVGPRPTALMVRSAYCYIPYCIKVLEIELFDCNEQSVNESVDEKV